MASLLKTGTGPSWLYFWQIWCWKEIGFFKVSNAVCYFSRPGIDPIFDTGLDMRWVGFMPHWWWLPHHCQENKNHVLCSVGSPPSQKDSDVNADIQEIIFRHDITMLCHMLILIIYLYTFWHNLWHISWNQYAFDLKDWYGREIRGAFRMVEQAMLGSVCLWTPKKTESI
jgi:hypothetical protein